MENITPHTNQHNNRPHEYFIYAYDNYDANKVGINRWHMIGTEPDEKTALKKAKNLFQSTHYQKIEVKKSTDCSKASIKLIKSFDGERNSSAAYIICGFFSALMLLSYIVLFQL